MRKRRWRCAAIVLTAATTIAACTSDDGADGGARETQAVSAATTDAADSTAPVQDPVATVDTETTEAVPAPDACVPRPSGTSRDVVMWHSLRNDAAIKFNELVARYNALDTGVTIVAESQGGYSDVVAALAASPPENRPDLVMFDQRGVRSLDDSEMFLPTGASAGGEEIIDDLVPVIAASYAIDDEVVAFPYNVSTPVLMYNATTLRAAGLDPDDPPATLDELSVAAEQIQASGAAKFGFVAHDGYGPWFVMQFNARIGELTGTPDNGRGAEMMERVSFAAEETIESFEWLRDAVASGQAVWVGSNVSGADDLIKLVDAEDSAAFTISTSASTGDIIHLLEAGSFPGAELGVAPLPGPGVTGGLVGGGSIWMTTQTDPTQAGAAFEVLDWLLAPAQHAEFAAFTGYSPVRQIELAEPLLLAAWEKYPVLRVGFDQLASLDPTAVWAGPAWGPGDEIHNLLYDAASQIIGGSPIVGTLETAANSADELLAVYAAVLVDD